MPEDASSILLSLKTWKALKELTHALKWSDTGNGEDSGVVMMVTICYFDCVCAGQETSGACPEWIQPDHQRPSKSCSHAGFHHDSAGSQVSGVAQQKLSKAVFTCRHYSSVTEMLHQRVDQDEDERCKDDQDPNEGGDGDRSKSNDDYCDSLFSFKSCGKNYLFFLLTTPFSQGMKFHSHTSRFLFNHSSSFFFTVRPPLCPVCACVCVCVCVFYSDDVYYFHCKGPQGGGSQVVPL